jgi:hypothetical protein
MDHLPVVFNNEPYNLSSLVRGETAPLQGLQGAMARYLMDDLLGENFESRDLDESAMDMASSLTDGITFGEIMRGNETLLLMSPRTVDEVVCRRLVEHSRGFLQLVSWSRPSIRFGQDDTRLDAVGAVH